MVPVHVQWYYTYWYYTYFYWYPETPCLSHLASYSTCETETEKSPCIRLSLTVSKVIRMLPTVTGHWMLRVCHSGAMGYVYVEQIWMTLWPI